MNWDIDYKDDYCLIGKRDGGKYSLDDIKELSKEYKYIYKATKRFRTLDVFDDKYSMVIFTNIEINDNLFDFFNNVSIRMFYLNNLDIMTLYSIKEKIEIL